jgi:hypothetical protein
VSAGWVFGRYERTAPTLFHCSGPRQQLHLNFVLRRRMNRIDLFTRSCSCVGIVHRSSSPATIDFCQEIPLRRPQPLLSVTAPTHHGGSPLLLPSHPALRSVVGASQHSSSAEPLQLWSSLLPVIQLIQPVSSTMKVVRANKPHVAS